MASRAPAASVLRWPLIALGACLPLTLAGTNAALGAATAALGYGLIDAKLGPVLRARLAAMIREPVFLAAGAYAAAALLSGLLGAGPGRSLAIWPKDLHKLWALVVLGALMGTAGRRGFVAGLAAGAAIAALAGIGQSLFITTGYEFYYRAHGFVHPVAYGEMLGLCLLAAAFLYGRLDSATGPRSRAATTALACLLIAAVLFNQTRAVLLAVVAGFVVVGLADPKWRKRVAWVLALGAGVILVWEWLPTGGRNFENIFAQTPDQPQRIRFTLWSVAWRMFRDHPWTGAGPGHYYTLFNDYFQGNLSGQTAWGSAHNLFLHQMAERGLLGLAALSAFLGTLSVSAWRRERAHASGWTQLALAATAAFLVMNMTETAFQTEQVATVFLAVWTLGQARPGDEFL